MSDDGTVVKDYGRTVVEKKPPRIKVPASWSGGKCMCCGKIYDVRKGNFSKTQSQWFMGNDGYLRGVMNAKKKCSTSM